MSILPATACDGTEIGSSLQSENIELPSQGDTLKQYNRLEGSAIVWSLLGVLQHYLQVLEASQFKQAE